jgi:hypothetical protein
MGLSRRRLRGRNLPWKTFLKAHWDAIAAADFFSVEVLTVGGLVRYLVLFVIELKTRRIHVAGITSRANGGWMAQIARNLIDSVTGPLNGVVYLIVDRDPLYTEHFKQGLRSRFTGALPVVHVPGHDPISTPRSRMARSSHGVKSESIR